MGLEQLTLPYKSEYSSLTETQDALNFMTLNPVLNRVSQINSIINCQLKGPKRETLALTQIMAFRDRRVYERH